MPYAMRERTTGATIFGRSYTLLWGVTTNINMSTVRGEVTFYPEVRNLSWLPLTTGTLPINIRRLADEV